MATGDRYEGNWVDGKKNGFGTCFDNFQVNTVLRMETFTRETLRTGTVKVRVFTPGLTTVTTRVSG